MHLVNNSIIAKGAEFDKYNMELDSEHYMWFWQTYQRWMWEEYVYY